MDRIAVVSDAEFRDEMRAKEISDSVGPVLATAYPGYRWRVEPHGNFVDIRCEMTNCRYGFRLLLRNWFSATQWKALVIKSAGEILERSHLSRRAFDEPQFRALPRNFAGHIAVDQ
jgi:hypothetical protein